MFAYPRLIVIADYGFVGSKAKWLNFLESISNSTWNAQFALQIRIKDADLGSVRHLASRARKIVGSNIPLILNDHQDLAQELGYNGIHFSQSNISSITSISARMTYVTAAVHDRDSLEIAHSFGVGAVLFAPVFQVSWKETEAQGIEALRDIANNTELPVFALGGVTPDTCGQCYEAGAYGVSVLSGVMGAIDPCSAIKRYLEKLEKLSQDDSLGVLDSHER